MEGLERREGKDENHRQQSKEVKRKKEAKLRSSAGAANQGEYKKNGYDEGTRSEES